MNEITQQALFNEELTKYCENVLPTITLLTIFILCVLIGLFIFLIGWKARGKMIESDLLKTADTKLSAKVVQKDIVIQHQFEQIEELKDLLAKEKRRNKIIDEVK